MKILLHLKSGAVSSFKSWKGILIIWLVTFVMIGIIAASAKSGLKSMIGSSMITELLRDSVNADVLTDLRDGLMVLLPSVTKGLGLLILITFITNAFFSAGLFNILGKKCSSKSLSCFLSGGASNFWSVLVINLIVTMIFIVIALLVGGIPALIVSKSGSGNPEPGALGRTIRMSFILMALLLPFVLLIADYARAWQTGNNPKKPFRAIGVGFAMTFGKFSISYPVMLILIIIQSVFGVFIVSKLLGSKPLTGGGVFLLFLVSQIFFIIKLFLRAWRYGSVTSMLETETIKVSPGQSEQVAEPLSDQV